MRLRQLGDGGRALDQALNHLAARSVRQCPEHLVEHRAAVDVHGGSGSQELLPIGRGCSRLTRFFSVS
jgi:hypothetical protein